MIVVRGGADSDWPRELEEKRKASKKGAAAAEEEEDANEEESKQYPFECHAFVCDSRQVRYDNRI